MSAKLKLVSAEPAPVATYALVGPTAHKCFAELSSRIGRVQASLSGNFTTTIKAEEAIRLLNEAEVLCRSTRNALRSGL